MRRWRARRATATDSSPGAPPARGLWSCCASSRGTRTGPRRERCWPPPRAEALRLCRRKGGLFGFSGQRSDLGVGRFDLRGLVGLVGFVGLGCLVVLVVFVVLVV